MLISASTITQDDKKMVKVSIRDYGIGIEEKYLAKIFSKFSRLDNPLSKKNRRNWSRFIYFTFFSKDYEWASQRREWSRR